MLPFERIFFLLANTIPFIHILVLLAEISTSPSLLVHYYPSMSPPDPLRHLLQKLMEAQLNRSNSTPPAPPPYSTNPPRTAMPELMSDIVYTDEPNPLAITIDATINVVGNNNILALTSSQPASTMTTSTTTAASNSSEDPSPAQATATSSIGQTSGTDNETSTPPSRKHDREAKAAKLASIILKALHQADGLTDDHGRKRTVSVILKCGIKVEGSNNEVFSDEDVNGLTSCSMHVSSGGRKRASSEPLTAPPPKRGCCLL